MRGTKVIEEAGPEALWHARDVEQNAEAIVEVRLDHGVEELGLNGMAKAIH